MPRGFTGLDIPELNLVFTTVLVDGRIVKRHGKLNYDVERIVRDAKASALRIRTAAGGPVMPPDMVNALPLTAYPSAVRVSIASELPRYALLK